MGWLSLDEADNDPSLFWKYVVEALRSVAGREVGAGALSLLESSQAPIDAVLTTLINDLFSVSGDVIVVLDDYHVIEAREVHDGVVFLLEHLPPQMHLIIASRADPPFSLARWRGDGGLTEIRAADLRFTPEESATYLDGTIGGALTAQDVATLDQRTEGWIAALQLAALSMQGRDDPASFIAGFAGDDRYIVDYLVEEVLQRQSEDVRQFLLQSSILDRLSGPLCDAVTGQANGGATLVRLERANLFLVPLDDRRRWYRYHHLFADVLRAHLLDEQADNVAVLHSRASGWFERSGEPAEAIRHALAAEDFDRAANLAELAIRSMAQARQEATMRGWLKVLPAEVVRVRPVLTVGFAGALLLAGEFEGVEGRLRDAERWLSMTESEARAAGMVVADEAGFRSLPGTIEAYRAALALVGGDVQSTVTHARRALELSPAEDHLIRASAAGVLGLAYWASGDLEAGFEAYAECVDGLRRVGHIADIFGCSIALADIRRTQGRLRDAMRIYEHALQANEPDRPVVRGTADMYVGMSELYRERDDLETASGTFHAGVGDLVVHNSPRRGLEFVTRKVTHGVALIAKGKATQIELGNLDPKRDWGYAPEYVDAMWRILQQPKPDDYVIGTGESHTVREFVQLAFREVGIEDWEKYVRSDPKNFRPAEVHTLCADPAKAKRVLHWEAKTKLPALVKLMVKADLERVGA